jgi:endonuclease YncB( thermonuclease family)
MVVENGYTVKGALIRSNESMKGKRKGKWNFFGIKRLLKFVRRNNKVGCVVMCLLSGVGSVGID